VPTPFSPGWFTDTQWALVIGVVCVIVLLWVTANLMRSRVGRSMRAVRDDEVAASLSGLSVAGVQVLAFVVSAAWAGLGGALLALANSNASPNAFSLTVSLEILAAVVVGGLGSLTGAVLGSFFIVMLTQTWAQSLATNLSISSAKVANNLPLLIYGVLLALAMLVAPGGVIGLARRLVLLVGPRRSRSAQPSDGDPGVRPSRPED
jgi:branched-chain amino acid transport system permease protein